MNSVTNGAWPAFWMGTKQSILCAHHVGELDILEGQGIDPPHFDGTINEWTGASDLVSTNSPNNNRFALPAGAISISGIRADSFGFQGP